MKYLLLISFILSFASAHAANADGKLKDVEADAHLASVKAQELEDQLSESDLFKECKETKETIKEIEDCIKSKFGDDFDPEEFAKKTDLKSFDRTSSKDAKSIREYLSERISNALHGKKEKGKMIKLVNHGVYSELYRSQVGKNILMDVSTYCIANLGYADNPYKVVNHCHEYIVKEKSGFTKTTGDGCDINAKGAGVLPIQAILGTTLQSKTIEYSANNGYTDKIENNSNLRTFEKDKFSSNPRTASTINIPEGYTSASTTIWSELTEYELNESCKYRVHEVSGKYVPKTIADGVTDGDCAIKTQDPQGNDLYKRVRNSSYIGAVKDLEFELGPAYMRGKYKFCSFTAIKNMCEVYRCRNIYHKQSGESVLKKCDEIGISDYNNRADEKATSPITNQSGTIACSLMAKLKQYRNNIAALDIIDKHNKTQVDGKGFAAKSYTGGFYTGGNDSNEKSIEQLTTISSAELAGKVDIGLGEEEIEELRQECITPDGKLSEEQKCQQLVSDLDDTNAKDVSAELETETQLYLKKIESLQDDDDIRDYLLKHGLKRYVSQIEDLGPDILKTIIADEYKSERNALKKSMMEKFNRLTKKKPPGVPPGESFEEAQGVIAAESLDNLDKQKETIQTLFQYNNVISSYMGAKVKGADDGDLVELSYQRDIELEGMKEFGDEDQQEKYETYSERFQDDEARVSSGNEKMDVNVQFIDSMLGNASEEE